jgi:hypothetical protein
MGKGPQPGDMRIDIVVGPFTADANRDSFRLKVNGGGCKKRKRSLFGSTIRKGTTLTKSRHTSVEIGAGDQVENNHIKLAATSARTAFIYGTTPFHVLFGPGPLVEGPGSSGCIIGGLSGASRAPRGIILGGEGLAFCGWFLVIGRVSRVF